MEPKTGLIVKIVVLVLLVTLFSMVIAFGVLWGEAKKTVEQKDKEIAELSKHTTTTTTPRPGTNGTGPPPVTSDTPFLRLPTHIVPINYNVDLRVYLPFDQSEENMPKAFTTTGTVRIRLMSVVADTRNITLHARTVASAKSGKLTFGKDKVRLTKGDVDVKIRDVDFQHKAVDVIVVETEEPLVANEEYVLIVQNFEGTIADDNQGLYRSSFERDKVKRYLATTQFQAFKARRVFPCFDEPGFRSTFDITLRHDARFTNTRSNGELGAKSTDDVDNKLWTVQQFATSPNMPAYLVAFLVSNFKTAELPNAPKPNRIFAIDDVLTTHDNARFPLQQSADSLTWMETNLAQDYYANGNNKLDQAGVPDFSAGAMENWGMVLYRESSLLYQPNVSSAEVKRGSAAIIGHELAHMIFGNLVTCKWWDDTWLNEGFARFFQYEMMNGIDRTKTWGLKPLFSYWVVREAMQSDAYDSAHPLYDPRVNTLPSIESMFDTITYAKGASMLQMIKGVMGRSSFYEAIKKYVKEFKFKNVDHTDLFRHLSDETSVPGTGAVNFREHLKSWVEQNGYPVVTLTRVDSPATAAGNQIRFTQKRFLMRTGQNASRQDADRDRTWNIPLSLASGEVATGSIIGGATDTDQYKVCWITAKEGDLSQSSCPQDLGFPTQNPTVGAKEKNFIIANLQQTGFYRVNYDEENWKRISAYLLNPRTVDWVSEVNRGQLIDDAFNLARAGDYGVPYKIVFDLIDYLKHEDMYGPFASAMDNIRYLDQMLRGNQADYNPLMEYMRRLFLNVYPSPANSVRLWNSITWTEDTAENGYTTLLFDNAVIENACYYENAQCLTETSERFKAWKNSGKLLSVSYTTAANANDPNPVLNFPQTKNMILCYGVRQAGSDRSAWDYLNEMHGKETSSGVKSSLLRALACTRNDQLLRDLLKKSVDKSVRDQDQSSVFSYISRWDAGAKQAWDFIQIDENWNNLTRRANIIADVTAAFNTPTQLDQLRAFNIRQGVGKSEEDAFRKAINKVEANIAWADASKTEVLTELRRKNT